MRTTRTTRVCVGDAPCTRAPTRTRAPRRTRCAAPPRPLCLPPRPLPTTHARKHPVHTKPSPRPSRRPPRAWPSLGVAPAATPAHMPCLCPPRACALPTAPPPAHANKHPGPVHTKPSRPTRGLLPPAPGPRSASRRRPPLPMPCPCARRPLARCTLARRPCPRAAPRRRAVTARFTAC